MADEREKTLLADGADGADDRDPPRSGGRSAVAAALLEALRRRLRGPEKPDTPQPMGIRG